MHFPAGLCRKPNFSDFSMFSWYDIKSFSFKGYVSHSSTGGKQSSSASWRKWRWQLVQPQKREKGYEKFSNKMWYVISQLTQVYFIFVVQVVQKYCHILSTCLICGLSFTFEIQMLVRFHNYDLVSTQCLVDQSQYMQDNNFEQTCRKTNSCQSCHFACASSWAQNLHLLKVSYS